MLKKCEHFYSNCAELSCHVFAEQSVLSITERLMMSIPQAQLRQGRGQAT